MRRPHLEWLLSKIDNNTITYDGNYFVAGSGIDSWTYVVLESDFTTSSTSNTNVTNFYFTPEINKIYAIEMFFLVQSVSSALAPRPGISWPSSITTNGATLFSPNSSTSLVLRNWDGSTTQNTGATDIPSADVDCLSFGFAMLVTGGSTTGNFQITLASDAVSVDLVQMTAGSFFRYKTIE